MKHESIIVVYDSCQALADEIADKLGAETVGVQSVNNRQIENSHSIVLALECQKNGELTPHWQWVRHTLCHTDLSGKNVAILLAVGDRLSHDADMFCTELSENNAHVVGSILDSCTTGSSLDNWICAVSPNL